MSPSPVLEINGLRVNVNGARWCGVTLAVNAGALVRLSGPSGSGKTTTLRAIARLQAHAQGTLALNGRDSAAVPAQQWRRTVAYLPQRPAMLPGTVEDNFRAVAQVSRGDHQYEAAATRQLCDALQLPHALLTQQARSLSGGEAARVALARALLAGPAVLLLDECTAALDPDAAGALVALVHARVRDHGCAAVVVAHQADAWGDAFSRSVPVETGS